MTSPFSFVVTLADKDAEVEAEEDEEDEFDAVDDLPRVVDPVDIGKFFIDQWRVFSRLKTEDSRLVVTSSDEEELLG